MPKKNLILSAALTAFVLVISVGVVNAFRQTSTTPIEIQSSPVVEQIVAEIPTQPAVVYLSAQEAALVAANYLKQTDIYSVEISVWNAADVYKVVFSSGDIIYVNFKGDVVAAESPLPVIKTVPSSNTESAQSPVYRAESSDHENDDD